MNWARSAAQITALTLCCTGFGWLNGAQAADSADTEEAQSALGDDRFVAALTLSDSVLEDPTPDLLAIRAQAYEALGLHSVAYWLSEAAAEALEGSGAGDGKASGTPIVDFRLPAEADASVLERVKKAGQNHSSEVWAEAAQKPWVAGDCYLTAAFATEWALYYPAEPAAHRLKGDAHRCTGAPRAALEAYEEVLKLGAGDASLKLVVEGLESNLAVLDVTLALTEGRDLPQLRLELPGLMVEFEAASGGTARFVGLPWGQELFLNISGSGYETSRHNILPLLISETRTLDVVLKPAGFGSISLAAAPPVGTAVFANEGSPPLQLEADKTYRVTSGQLPLIVAGPAGRVPTEVSIKEGEHLVFDPLPWVPTALRVSGLPAGTMVRVFVEGQGEAVADRSAFLPPGEGTLDEATGVQVAEPLTLRGLVGGTGGLFLEHSVLGDSATVLMLEPGGSNALQFRWRSMTGVPQVAARYATWQEGRSELVSSDGRRRGRSIAATILTGVAAACLVGAARAVEFQLGEAQARGVAAAAKGQAGIGDLHDARADSLNWSRTRTALLIGAGTAGAGVVLGMGLSLRIDRRGRARLVDYGEWAP
jgi:hypothetical protein